MLIEIKNLPFERIIACIKAFRMSFQKENGETYGLIETKNAVCEARDKAIADGKSSFSLVGIRRTKYFDKPLTWWDTVNYVTLNINDGCGLSGAEVNPYNPKIKINKNGIRKFDTKGRQVFNVPNDEDGRKFLADMAKYINRERVGFKNRGRGSRKNAGDKNFLPLEHAEWIAVYLNPKS